MENPHIVFLQRLARNELRFVCVCVSVWFPTGKKKSILRSHLMICSLCTGACNENQGCVTKQGLHVGREQADKFFHTSGPNHKWERSRRGRGLLTCEPSDPLNGMTWGGGRETVKHAMLPAGLQTACDRKHMGVVCACSAEVHECTLQLCSFPPKWGPRLSPIFVCGSCTL